MRTARSAARAPVDLGRAQAAYVIRTYLLNAANGVQRVYWYTWDMGYLPGGTRWATRMLTSPADGASPTLAGESFGAGTEAG